MTLSNQQRGQLTRLLSRELAGVRDFLQCLEQEYEVLSRGDAEGISHCTARKQALMHQVQQNLVDRRGFLRGEFGVIAAEGNLSPLTEQLERDDPLAAAWQQLQQLSLRLQEQNDINGNMINHSQQHVRQAIDLLTGSAAYDHTYGPRGNRSQERQAHTLARV